jgi:hypothetical protein
MTLKFRTPDILLAAAFHARAKRGNREMKFEEDIAPLQVARTKRSGKRVVAVPEPRASYSRFAVSIDRQAERPPATLAKAVSLYPVLKGELGQTTGVRNWHLQPGHTFCEWIFRGVKADIGKAKAVFTLTLWYRAKGADEGAHERVVAKGATPAIAEISFTIGAARALKPASARRAAQLFVAMQEMLPVNHEATSKTELALPG